MSTGLPIANLADLAEAISDQPSLFAAPDVQAVAAARECVHTGRWTMQHAPTVARIVAAWLNTGSLRKTAELVGMSRNTVSAVIRILEAGGKVEPLKTRFERERLETGMEQLQWVREVIEERDLEAAAVVLKPGWVGVGIVSDKEAAQPPASLHLHVHQVSEGAVDPVAEYERMLRRARSATVVDVESAVCPPNCLPPSPSISPATATATADPSISTPTPTTDHAPDPDAPDPAGPGGGGSPPLPPGGGSDRSYP